MARARLSMALEIRRLIRDMSLANPLWGAPRIHHVWRKSSRYFVVGVIAGWSIGAVISVPRTSGPRASNRGMDRPAAH